MATRRRSGQQRRTPGHAPGADAGRATGRAAARGTGDTAGPAHGEVAGRAPAEVAGRAPREVVASDAVAGHACDEDAGGQVVAPDAVAGRVSGAAAVGDAVANRAAGRATGDVAEHATGGMGGQSGRQTHDPHAKAREACLRLLTTAPRTRAQLATALRSRGVPESVAEEVLGRFAEIGLIDDVAFASAWVESRHYSRGLSRRALAAELRQRGVGDDEVRGALGELDPQQEAATARRLVNAKLAATRGQSPQVRTRRLAGMLARRGYPAAMVFRVVREALEQEGIDAAEAGLDESAEAAFEAADEWPDGTEAGLRLSDEWPDPTEVG